METIRLQVLQKYQSTKKR